MMVFSYVLRTEKRKQREAAERMARQHHQDKVHLEEKKETEKEKKKKKLLDFQKGCSAFCR